MKSIFAKYPFFLLLLPFFFFQHALLENFSTIVIIDAIFLFLIYTGVSMVIASLFWFLFKNLVKASLAAFFIMSFNFFFGSVYDFLKDQFGHPFFIQFRFILPLTFILFIILILSLKKSKRTFSGIVKYLNLLLLVLILIDTATILLKKINYKGHYVEKLSGKFISCDTCTRPDIYLIIADEYAGKTVLQDLFNFDNTGFENELQSRGFHIVKNSASNYNATVYSMASLLNMDYISHLNKPVLVNQQDMLICRSLINTTNLADFLIHNGYNIYNFSFFDFADKKKKFNNFFFPSVTSLLTSQTFIKRILFHFGARIVSAQKIIDIKKNNLYNDIKIDSLTRNAVLKKEAQPKFVYTHFDKPHHPYYYDSKGNEVPVDSLTDEFTMDRKAYIEYLQYTNDKLLSLVDFIKKHSANPPVIILMGDHGFRQLPAGVDNKYWFINLNAVYFPNGEYSGFYDGMTNVNQFRVTLNSLFGQKLPLLNDSASFLKE